MSPPLNELELALATFDREAAKQYAVEGEAQRKQILERFPLDTWPQLSLERYAAGQEDSSETFCRWLERRSQNLGSIRGGSARKLLIYKRKAGPGWWHEEKYRDEQAAWVAVRAGFVQALAYGKAREFEKVDELEALQAAPALRVKTLHVYFPDQVLPINSRAHLEHYLERLGQPAPKGTSWATVTLNRLLLRTLQALPLFKGWSNSELERFLYHWADPREAKKIVKIAPGHDAEFWEDCLQKDFICVGWGLVGDLTEYETEEDFFTQFEETYRERYKGHAATLKKKARELWMLRELEPGDLVVANQGISRVLAVGEVQAPGYEWHPEREKYKHTVRVKWDTSYATDIPPQKRWALVTVAPVPNELYQQIVERRSQEGGTGASRGGAPPVVTIDPLFMELEAALERKRQVILYGPPGTGKTYAARRFVAWWLKKKLGDAQASSVLSSPEKLQEAEQSLSTTRVEQRVFWSVANAKEWHWDTLFKKGRDTLRYGRIKRNYEKLQVGDLVIGYLAAPEKRIVALARISHGLQPNRKGELEIGIEPVTPIDGGLTWDELLQDPILSKSEPIRFNNQGTLFSLSPEEADHLLEQLAERDRRVEPHVSATDGVGQLTFLTFHPSYSYEDFVEGFRPVEVGSGPLTVRLEDGVFKRICRAALANPDKPYLVLIDEINRANLAKVFGELITLLEKDKRGLRVTLPQSKEGFVIPDNVYLLGTMNTADRSIKLMDAALRRRFAFLELMPRLDLLQGGKVEGLELDDFLEELNRRIAAREGREKQIGHAFLLGPDGEPIAEPEEFARRFRQEILPLLQEYCYDDYGALAEYLGERIVKRDARRLDAQVLEKPEELIAALVKALQSPESEQ
jgi:5-methylcytosine-specific restriction protein B